GDWTEERQRAARRYTELLRDVPGAIPFQVRSESAHVFHLYVVRVEKRDEVKAKLGERNIQCGIHYPQPLHLLPAYKHLGYAKGPFPVAEKLASQILSLPLFPEITIEQQRRVVDALKEHTAGAVR